VCTSTRSKPDLAVESLGVPLLTHYAVRIDRPKTEHVSRTPNARHVFPERTADRQEQTAWPVLAFGDEMPLNTHFRIHHRRTTRHYMQRCQSRKSCHPGKIDWSWMLCPARSVFANPSAIYDYNAISSMSPTNTNGLMEKPGSRHDVIQHHGTRTRYRVGDAARHESAQNVWQHGRGGQETAYYVQEGDITFVVSI